MHRFGNTDDVGESRGEAPLWHTWAQDSRDVINARSVLERFPLKGMRESSSLLPAKHATVFGVGATGGVASGLLAQSGIGFLDLVDPDSYGKESFSTQPTTFDSHGRSKALVQGERAQRINPACRVRAAVCHAQDLLLRDLRDADVFVVAGDNILLLLWAGRMAAALSKPLVQAAVHGETASAIVRGYDLRDVKNACPKCGTSTRELGDLTSRFGCDLATTRPTNGEATRTMPAICNAAGVLAANEAVKWLTDAYEIAMCGEEFVCSMFAYQSWRTKLQRNIECDLPHSKWDLEDLPTTANEVTLAALAGHLGQTMSDQTLQVRGEIPWVRFSFCGNCGRKTTVRRFARRGCNVGRCDCEAMLTTSPQGMRSVVPPDDLHYVWDKPIGKLGINSGEAIGILNDERWTYFFSDDNAKTEN